MKQLKREPGFGMVGIVLVIVVIVAIAAGVLFVYEQYSKNGTKSSVSTNTTQTTTKPKSTTSTEPSPTPTNTNQDANTYMISELNAKMTLPAGLTASDLKYVIRTNDSVPMAYFSTTSLNQAAGGGCDPSEGPIGVIWRTTQNPTNGNEFVVKQIGQYYYAFDAPQGFCTAKAGNLEQSQTALLKQAFETISTIN